MTIYTINLLTQGVFLDLPNYPFGVRWHACRVYWRPYILRMYMIISYFLKSMETYFSHLDIPTLSITLFSITPSLVKCCNGQPPPRLYDHRETSNMSLHASKRLLIRSKLYIESITSQKQYELEGPLITY